MFNLVSGVQRYIGFQSCCYGSSQGEKRKRKALLLVNVVMTLGFQLLTCFCVTILQQLMASKSDAPFRDAKAKLMEIRAKYFTVTGKKSDAKERKSKRQKKSN